LEDLNYSWGSKQDLLSSGCYAT